MLGEITMIWRNFIYLSISLLSAAYSLNESCCYVVIVIAIVGIVIVVNYVAIVVHVAVDSCLM